jgi:hypothetical protein
MKKKRALNYTVPIKKTTITTTKREKKKFMLKTNSNKDKGKLI